MRSVWHTRGIHSAKLTDMKKTNPVIQGRIGNTCFRMPTIGGGRPRWGDVLTAKSMRKNLEPWKHFTTRKTCWTETLTDRATRKVSTYKTFWCIPSHAQILSCFHTEGYFSPQFMQQILHLIFPGFLYQAVLSCTKIEWAHPWPPKSTGMAFMRVKWYIISV